MARRALLALLLFSAPWAAANALLDAANRAYLDGNLKKAEFLYKQALNSGENQALIYYNLANVNYRMEKVGESIGYYRKVMALAPTFKDSYHNLGKIFFSFDNYVAALEVFRAYLAIDPLDEDTLLLVGDTCKKLGLYKQAEEQYRLIFATNTQSSDAWQALASLYLDLGDNARALQLVESGVRANPNNRLLRDLQAGILRDLGQFREAAAVYEILLTGNTNLSDEQKAQYTFLMADAYQQSGMGFLAIGTLRDLLRRWPDRQQAIDYLGGLYAQMNKWDDAFEFYAELFPKNRAQGYLGIKKVFTQAVNQQNKDLLKKLVEFYGRYKIRDELIQLMEARAG
ncbi:MAG: tetratricopeptide repeat protein [Spirochaetes bacterium]|nr:tetratricopeptide repeat protein [Spirochaetota bacterium]